MSGRKFMDLTAVEMVTVRDHYREAVRARIAQWDNERAIEKILGREVELNIPDIAAVVDNPSRLTLKSVKEALGE